jgi:predicted nucleic acid-binding protein
MRFHLRAGVDATVESAKELLAGISALPRHEFWADDAPYLALPVRGIMGHRQVTDAYLAMLAARHGGVLATTDEGLAAVQDGVLLID